MMKMKMDDAKKMERDGFYLIHIDHFTERTGYSIIHDVDLMKKHPDCSHALITPGKRWRDYNAIAALILKGEDDE